MAHLFDGLPVRGITLPNRIVVSPMCQYSATDGVPNDWHFVHLGSRAVGGAGLVFTEATAVTPEGRISPADTGLWSDAQMEAFARITRFIAAQGALAGIQLAHAGRKASTWRPWDGHGGVPPDQGGWQVVAPGDDAFAPGFPVPRALTTDDVSAVARAFADAARRAHEAGFSVIELHAAHGYLLHQFLSPLVNRRTDRYGGTFDNRVRIVVETVEAIRRVWPMALPLFMRISATDWVDGGWALDDSIALAKRVASLGVDVIDCSSGGVVATGPIPVGPGYQSRFAAEIKRAAGIMTGAVGLITSPTQADHIIRSEQADVVLLAREMLRDPYWSLHAAKELGHVAAWPPQYLRAAPTGSTPRLHLAPESHR